MIELDKEMKELTLSCLWALSSNCSAKRFWQLTNRWIASRYGQQQKPTEYKSTNKRNLYNVYTKRL